MWPLSCLAYVVSQMLSSSFLQGFSMCCLVVCRLSPEMWSQNCPHIETFDNPDLFPRIGLPIISTCLPFVALLFPSCLSDLSDVVPHLPPSCLALVLQIWSFPRLRVSSRCAFPILSQLFSTLPHNAQLSARFSHPIISHSFSLAFQIVSELPPRCGLPVVS